MRGGIEPQDRYCCQCGRVTAAGFVRAGEAGQRRLTLSKHDKKIAGVCSGFAHYLDVDVTLVRIIWLMLPSRLRAPACRDI